MTARPLRVCFVVPYYAEGRESVDIDRYLSETPIHRALPRALAARGHQVQVVHLFPREVEWWEGGVRHHFVRAGRGARTLGHWVGRLRGRDRAYYEPAWRAIERVRACRPDIVHVHGATLNLNLHLLLRALGTETPVVLHYHGGYPSRHRLVRRLQRANFARAACYCFTTQEHAQPFVETGVIARPERVVELMETSSSFRPSEREPARALTGMQGDPVFLWVGRLHPIKDPLTALRGFERVLAAWPEAQLYLHYLSDECLPLLRGYLTERPALRAHVHPRGPAPFERMETIYNSADFLLQASLREFSGCAVLEAMACGTIPVVTDIPSFRRMTGDGQAGVLFPRGDDRALAAGVLALGRDQIASSARETRARFERELSFASLAARLEEVYAGIAAP
ncbi:MAG TPA: glycosyltransferase family 4 protein [Thermomicrobiaceae bacterium]|nr:glycosyltransferase family 4 protein [Thermomicrobiaceae bacterium]